MPTPSCRLETNRLGIDPYSDVYVTSDYVGWLNDPEVMKYSENRYRHFTLEECRNYAASFEGSPHYLWAIVRKDTKQHIGNINAYVDGPNKLADVGILIGARASWGAGYGLEAWKAVCAWLLKEAGMRKVTAGTLDTNIGMKRIMEKSGMIADGRRVRHYLNNGAEVDILYAALFA